MVIERVGNGNIFKHEWDELNKLAEKGISEEELNSVIVEYENQEQQDAVQSFEEKCEQFKRKSSQEKFKSGSGSFKRV